MDLRKKLNYRFCVTLPLVIYHGKGDRNIKTSLGEIITGYEELSKDIQEFIPNYKYLLYDILRYTDEEIKGEVITRIAMTIMRDIFTKDSEELLKSLSRSIEYLQELEDKQTGIEYFETLMRYIFSAGKDLSRTDINEIVKKIESTYPEGSERVMTLAEIFRKEGMEEGIEKGMEKGMEKGETKVLEKAVIKLL